MKRHRSITVQVINPTAGDLYAIYYGTAPGTYGPPVQIPAGQSSISIPGFTVGKTYYFANRVTRGAAASSMSNPIAYTVKRTAKQEVKL